MRISFLFDGNVSHMTDPLPDGFDLLAAILRPKMPQLVDVACAKVILSMLGIHVDKPGWVSQ